MSYVMRCVVRGGFWRLEVRRRRGRGTSRREWRSRLGRVDWTVCMEGGCYFGGFCECVFLTIYHAT